MRLGEREHGNVPLTRQKDAGRGRMASVRWAAAVAAAAAAAPKGMRPKIHFLML